MVASIPDLGEYLGHLRNALKYFDDNREVAKIPGLKSQVSASRRQLYGVNPAEWSLRTEPAWEFPVECPEFRRGVRARLIFGIDIAVVGNKIAQHVVSFSITTEDDKRQIKELAMDDSCCMRQFSPSKLRVIRRAHFDIDVGSHDDPRPWSHLQIGGRGPLAPADSIHYCLDPYLDSPRIPMPPMDPVLVLEFLMAQFHVDEFSILPRDGYWLNLVRTSQELWSNRFFESQWQFLSGGGDDRTLYSHVCRPA
jgi:hypothetical protein